MNIKENENGTAKYLDARLQNAEYREAYERSVRWIRSQARWEKTLASLRAGAAN